LQKMTSMASRSPLAARSANEDVPTPSYYKVLGDKPADEDDILPPPPPAFEDDAPSPVAASNPDRALAMYVGGHASFAYLYFSSMPIISVVSWLFLSVLIINAGALSVTGKASSRAEWTPDLAPLMQGINAAVGLFNRFATGEPKLTFMAACGAWGLAVTSSFVSPLALAWLGYGLAMGNAVLSADTNGKLDGFRVAAAAKVASLATEKRREALFAAVAPKVDKMTAAYTELQAHSEQIKFVAPVVAFLVWLFWFGWTNKFLLGGMAFLGYKAWASPEAAAQLDAKIGKAARASRRMTLSAADRIGLMKNKVA